jgi:para-aminobenzoate synthetase component 1
VSAPAVPRLPDLAPVRAGALPTVVLERVPSLDRLAPVDVAEAFRDLPGTALLESARPGPRSRWTFLTADPIDTLERVAEGPDPFADARRLLARASPAGPIGRQPAAAGHRGAAPDGVPDRATRQAAPPFLGGLVGYLGYDLGRELERLPAIAPDDQRLAPLRLALHDWVLAWDRLAGRAWLAGRAVDDDAARLGRRLDSVRRRLDRAAADGWPRAGGDAPRDAGSGGSPGREGRLFRSGLPRARYEEAVEAVRGAIERGDIYQANLTRRLESDFAGDPWPLYRRLRTGDPARFAAYLDLGRGDEPANASEHRAGAAWDGGLAGWSSTVPERGGQSRRARRAILSASPEPFLAVDPFGLVVADPIKGTRPRGRDRDEDRRLAAELLGSPKDRAENVMIVDVLRNDLGRVCRPGTVRVPRLCRLERTATVQHLVSTVTGVLRPDCDAFDLLAAAFPGGSITGAPKIRAMEIVEHLEPVRRGPYTGALGWMGPDGAMGTSILIRTFVADGRRLTLHVGGGITHRSDPGAEWDETVAKASGPLGALGARETGGETAPVAPSALAEPALAGRSLAGPLAPGTRRER